MTKATYASLLAVLLIAGCGGGGSSTSTSAPASVVKRATAGDVYTYARTETTVGGNVQSYYFSREYQLVNDDGSSVDVETYSNDYAATLTSVSANGGIKATSLRYDESTYPSRCTYSPESIGATPPYQTGKSWDNSWTKTCNSKVFKETNKGSIVGMESVTVPAGTFNAYKEVYVVTSQQTTPTSDQVTTTNITCWRDVDLRQYVKCEFSTSYSAPPAEGTDPMAKTVYEMTGYIVSAAAKNVPTVARYAGKWVASYFGSEIGSCENLSISTTGEISGSCVTKNVTGEPASPYPVTGSVDVQGNVTISSSSPNTPTLTGRLPSVSVLNSGKWGANMESTWGMAHR